MGGEPEHMMKWLLLAGMLALLYVVGSLIFETLRRYRRLFSLEHMGEVATLLGTLKQQVYADAGDGDAPSATGTTSRELEIQWQREVGEAYTTHRLRFRLTETHLAISAGTRMAAFAINRLGVADKHIAFKHDHDTGSFAGFRLDSTAEAAFASQPVPPLDDEAISALCHAIDPTVDRLAN